MNCFLHFNVLQTSLSTVTEESKEIGTKVSEIMEPKSREILSPPMEMMAAPTPTPTPPTPTIMSPATVPAPMARPPVLPEAKLLKRQRRNSSSSSDMQMPKVTIYICCMTMLTGRFKITLVIKSCSQESDVH